MGMWKVGIDGVWTYTEEEEDPRWEGPPEEKGLTLEQYLWERVKRAETRVRELSAEVYKLNKKLANSTVTNTILPPPIGGA